MNRLFSWMHLTSPDSSASGDLSNEQVREEWLAWPQSRTFFGPLMLLSTGGSWENQHVWQFRSTRSCNRLTQPWARPSVFLGPRPHGRGKSLLVTSQLTAQVATHPEVTGFLCLALLSVCVVTPENWKVCHQVFTWEVSMTLARPSSGWTRVSTNNHVFLL